MRRSSIALLGSIVIAVFALVAAGCGGGGEKNSAATTTTQLTTTEAATTTTELTTTTSSSGAGVAAETCRGITDLGKTLSSASSATITGEAVMNAARRFQDIADKAPEEIRSQFKIVADFVSKYADIAADFKPGKRPDATALAKLQEIVTSAGQKLRGAQRKIAAWATKNCTS